MRILTLLAPILVIACSQTETKEAPPPASTPVASTPKAQASGDGKGVVIKLGSDGQAKVEGAAPLHGDPKVCAALKKCCDVSEMGLFCAMGQDLEGGDCAKLLVKAKQYAKEAKVTAPACR